MHGVYKVKRSITLPLCVAVALSFPVFGFSIQSDAPTAKLIWTFLLMLLFYVFALNKIVQRVRLSDEGLEFTSLLGRRTVKTADIQNIDGASLGSRQFVILTSKRGARHFSNSLTGFSELARNLKEATPPEIQGSGLHTILARPLSNRRDALAPWIAVLVLIMLLISNAPL